MPVTLQLTQVPMPWHNGEDVQRPYWRKGCTIKEEVSGKDKVTDAVITRVYPAGVSWSPQEQTPGPGDLTLRSQLKGMSKQPRDKYVFDDYPTKGLQLKPRPKDILDSY